MLCSEKEIGIGNDEKGIIILKDNKIKNGAKAYKYFDQNEDFIFDISLTPNRADAASHLGVARDLKSVLNISSINLPKDNLSESNSKRIEVDFNKAYNPYCEYDIKYTCPIPPKENNIPLKILAGEKKYFKWIK